MVCGKCKHEFCWFCLGPYYAYTHTVEMACPFRQTALILYPLLMFLIVNFKMGYSSEFVCYV
jgi:hypothetical protein